MRIEAIAWRNCDEGRKAPHSRAAGEGYADPGYSLSDEWRAARERIQAAESCRSDPASPLRVLVICASPRNDGTCRGRHPQEHWMIMIILR